MPDRLLAPAAVATLLCLTATAVSGQAPPARTPGTMNAEQGWGSIARCAQEDSERARHTCLDRVLRDAGLLTPEMHALQQRRAFGLDNKAATAPATPPATAATSPAASAEALNRRAAGTTSDGATPATAANSPAASAEALNRRAAGTTTAVAPPATSAPRPATAASSGTAATPPSAAAGSAQPDRLEAELTKVEKAVDGKLFVTTTDGAVWLQIETVDMPQPPVAGDRMSIRKGSLGGYRCSIASTHLTYRCARNR